MVGKTCRANIIPNLSVSSNGPNKNELPSLVKSNNLVIPLLIHSKTALPAGTFRISNAKIICIKDLFQPSAS